MHVRPMHCRHSQTDRRANIMVIEPRFVLTNASRAKNRFVPDPAVGAYDSPQILKSARGCCLRILHFLKLFDRLGPGAVTPSASRPRDPLAQNPVDCTVR